jgi:hypothetical protein
VKAPQGAASELNIRCAGNEGKRDAAKDESRGGRHSKAARKQLRAQNDRHQQKNELESRDCCQDRLTTSGEKNPPTTWNTIPLIVQIGCCHIHATIGPPEILASFAPALIRLYSLLPCLGRGFQRILVLALENEITSLVVHRRPRCH